MILSVKHIFGSPLYPPAIEVPYQIVLVHLLTNSSLGLAHLCTFLSLSPKFDLVRATILVAGIDGGLDCSNLLIE